jgi:hypothetical protein
LSEANKPGVGIPEGLLPDIDMGKNLLIRGTHKIQQAAVLMEVGAIVDYVADLG